MRYLIQMLRCGANGRLHSLGGWLAWVVVALCFTSCVTMYAHEEYHWGADEHSRDNLVWQTTVGPRVMTLPAVGRVAGAWVYELQAEPTPLYLVIRRREVCHWCPAEILDTLPKGDGCPVNYPPVELVVSSGVIPIDFAPEEDADGNPRRALLSLKPIRSEYDWASLKVPSQVIEVPANYSQRLSYQAQGKLERKAFEVMVKGPLEARPEVALYLLTGAADLVLAPLELVAVGVLWAGGWFDYSPWGGH